MSTEIGGNNKEPLDETLVIGNETGGTNIVTDDGDEIQAKNGDARLILRHLADSIILLSNGTVAPYVDRCNLLMTSTVCRLAFGVPSTNAVVIDADNIQLIKGLAGGFCQITTYGIHFGPITSYLGGPDTGVVIVDNSTGDTNHLSVTNISVALQTGTAIDPSTTISGVSRTVILGGRGITAKTDDTAYVNQMSFQFVGNTFDTMVRGSLATADRTQTLQDDSGSIALLKNIAISQFAVNLDSAEATVTRVFAGGRTTFTVTHTANSLDIKPQVFRLSDGRTIEWRIERTSTSTVECSRAGNVADGLFRFLI